MAMAKALIAELQDAHDRASVAEEVFQAMSKGKGKMGGKGKQ